MAARPIASDSTTRRKPGAARYFTPHLGKLAYGTDYFGAIPSWCISGKLNGADFAGLSNSNKVATWKFTTKPAPTLDFTKVTVDGSQASRADFRSSAAALNLIAVNAAAPASVTINVAAGTYRELLRYNGPGGDTPQTVSIVGPEANKQGDTYVFQFANGNNVNGSTQTRVSFTFTGANLVLANVTLKNTASRDKYAQAETLYFASGGNYTLAAYNSSFFSNQDTLQTSGRNWFYKCYIEGNVDFIWGTAQAALFEDCTMRFITDQGSNPASYSMVVARTGATVAGNGTVGKGYVVLKSKVTVDANVTASFGRNAGGSGFYDQVALINVAFDGDGTIGAGLWNTSSNKPLSMGDASYVGWKSSGCTGLNIGALTTAEGTSASIASQATEYDTRDHILNRVVTISAGAPSGYEAVPAPWDLSALATAWGAP
jgi:pectate lyase